MNQESKLTELIDSCGDVFLSIDRHRFKNSVGFDVKWITNFNQSIPGKIRPYFDTAEQAVSSLLEELNKKI